MKLTENFKTDLYNLTLVISRILVFSCSMIAIGGLIMINTITQYQSLSNISILFGIGFIALLVIGILIVIIERIVIFINYAFEKDTNEENR